MDNEHPRRRALLASAAATGLVVLSGCQVYGGSGSASGAAPGGGATPPPAPDGAAGTPGAAALAQVADIPVGGGKVFADKGVVVTQPQQGTIRAFSASCTHQGCTVSGVAGGTINCACHGSTFKVADGSVAKGPAGEPLAPVGVTVDGTAIHLA